MGIIVLHKYLDLDLICKSYPVLINASIFGVVIKLFLKSWVLNTFNSIKKFHNKPSMWNNQKVKFAWEIFEFGVIFDEVILDKVVGSSVDVFPAFALGRSKISDAQASFIGCFLHGAKR